MTKNPALRVAMAVFCAAGAIPVPSVAQHNTDNRQPRYKLIDLGTFGGVTSYINPVGNGGPYMNGKGMVVGSSMTSIPIPLVFDLNTLIPRNSSLLLVESNAINDRGEIAGNGFPSGCTDFSCTHAFVLILCEGEHSNDEGCDTSQDHAETMIPKFVPANQGSANVDRIGLPSAELINRMRGRSGPYRFLGGWPRH